MTRTITPPLLSRDYLAEHEQAIVRLETAQADHVRTADEADALEERMTAEREAAISRLIAAGKSPSAAEKQPGADADYSRLRDERRRLSRARQTAEYAVLAASRRVTLAEERTRYALAGVAPVRVGGL